MDDLPDELIANICRFCTEPEIKALRLAGSRKIQRVADEHLFTEVVVFMNRVSLEACRGLAAHDIFSKTVDNLWIQADRPKKMTYKEWSKNKRPYLDPATRDRIRESATRIMGTDSQVPMEERFAVIRAESREIRAEAERAMSALTQEQLRNRYTHSVRLARESTQIHDDGSLMQCFRDILAQCPNVKSVDLTLGHHLRVSTAGDNIGFRKGMVQPFGDITEYDSGVHVMGDLVLAASDVGFKPRVLNLGCVSHFVFMREDLVGYAEKLRDFFENLEELTWEFLVPVYGENYTLDFRAFDDVLADIHESKNLVSLLSAASGLKQLRLDLPHHADGHGVPLLSRVVGLTTWQHLAKLNIANFETFPEHLTDLLLRHKQTLKLVQLGAVALSGGVWLECFKALAGRLPHVEAFELRGRFDEEDGETFHTAFSSIRKNFPNSSRNFSPMSNTWSGESTTMPRWAALVSLMEHTTKLQHLCLDLPDYTNGDNVTLQDIVGGTTWRYLTHLDIANFEAKPDDLTDLLIRHRDTLTYVKLGTVCLQTGTWPECFESFAGKLPKIEQFEFRSRFSDDTIGESFLWFGWPHEKQNNARGEEVRKFIITGGEECPTIRYQHEEGESTSEHRSEGNDEDGNDDREGDEDDDEA
ncbi:unnamed protein product [Zymoseptoria tritici ST99CH_1A5]|uniref:F-box domain-containing protein n=1 Tax=Zymoseptoria tritici ST99CH_1A5 TaxID=1276529 RepID=A0A1Y6LSX1_ZYMTR|nr:unnamed protein product [Zymoseptoria tritici ST99CH_1A5]